MGNKDKTRDGNAATDRDHSRDQESRDAVLARTIAKAVAGALAKQNQKRHSLSQKHLQGKWRRYMHNMRSF